MVQELGHGLQDSESGTSGTNMVRKWDIIDGSGTWA